MKVLGITGSIGAGKSFAAECFAARGAAVLDADKVARALLEPGAEGFIPVSKQFPTCIKDGRIDRRALAQTVLSDPKKLAVLEGIIHPLVRRAEEAFIAESRAKAARIIVLDIPLLFETGAEKLCDKVAVVSAPREARRTRVLERGVSEEVFERMDARQMPQEEKIARADYIIKGVGGKDLVTAQADAILRVMGVQK